MKRVKSFGPNSFKPKMKGGMPRMKKFEEGGDVEVGEGLSAAMNAGASSSRRRDDEPVAKPKSQSFSDAFREARKAGLKTFKWNGGTYGTKLKGEDAKSEKTSESKPSGPTTRGGRRNPTYTLPDVEITARRPGIKLPSDRATNFASQAKETGMSPEERAKTASRYIGNIAGAATLASGLGALRGAATAAPNALRAGQIGVRGTTMAERERAAAAAEKATERFRRLKESGGMGSGRGAGRQYAAGGSVKAFAKGGSVRGGGCETKGKTKGRFV